jgi:predicted naringenin-chalcone synthase
LSKITSIATATPVHQHSQDSLFQFANKVFCNNETDSRKLGFLYRHSGIQYRHSVVPDFGNNEHARILFPDSDDLEPFPTLEHRMQIYEKEAVKLSVKAITQCIAGKINPEDITHLITVSCTGMSAPGLDLEIMETMGLSPNLQRTSVNFMGCYAAIHGLKMADAICAQQPKANIMVVCTELCTLHFQKEI